MIRFSFFYQSTSINRITDYETLEEVQTAGVETVANQCIEEIKEAIGMDLIDLVNPHNHLVFCEFIQLKYSPENNEIIEKERLKLQQ